MLTSRFDQKLNILPIFKDLAFASHFGKSKIWSNWKDNIANDTWPDLLEMHSSERPMSALEISAIKFWGK